MVWSPFPDGASSKPSGDPPPLGEEGFVFGSRLEEPKPGASDQGTAAPSFTFASGVLATEYGPVPEPAPTLAPVQPSASASSRVSSASQTSFAMSGSGLAKEPEAKPTRPWSAAARSSEGFSDAESYRLPALYADAAGGAGSSRVSGASSFVSADGASVAPVVEDAVQATGQAAAASAPEEVSSAAIPEGCQPGAGVPMPPGRAAPQPTKKNAHRVPGLTSGVPSRHASTPEEHEVYFPAETLAEPGAAPATEAEVEQAMEAQSAACGSAGAAPGKKGETVFSNLAAAFAERVNLMVNPFAFNSGASADRAQRGRSPSSTSEAGVAEAQLQEPSKPRRGLFRPKSAPLRGHPASEEEPQAAGAEQGAGAEFARPPEAKVEPQREAARPSAVPPSTARAPAPASEPVEYRRVNFSATMKVPVAAQPAADGTPARPPMRSFTLRHPPIDGAPAPSPRRPPSQRSLSAAAAEAEDLRQRGNDAFAARRWEEARRLYSSALRELSVDASLTPRCAPLLSNRAAAWLSLGRPVRAAEDCIRAWSADAAFARAGLRLATCHCRLGAFGAAAAALGAVLARHGGDAGVAKEARKKEAELRSQARTFWDAVSKLSAEPLPAAVVGAWRRVLAVGRGSPAAPGEEASELDSPSREPSAASAAESTREALGDGDPQTDPGSEPSVSEVAPADRPAALGRALKDLASLQAAVPHSDLLLAARAVALLRLGRAAEALAVAGKPASDEPEHAAGQASDNLSPRRAGEASWRHWVRAHAALALGDGDAALQAVQRYSEAAESRGEAGTMAAAGEGALSATPPYQPWKLPPSTLPAFLLEACESQASLDAELLRALLPPPPPESTRVLTERLARANALRALGNAAIRAGDYARAVDCYGQALAEPRLTLALRAVLHCNRAAAHQGAASWAPAVADCCRAKALRPDYHKAHSRLAALLGELGRHAEAAQELETLLALPGGESAERAVWASRRDQARAAARLAEARALRVGASAASAHHYRLLGLPPRAGEAEVKKGYRRLALALHPDKALQLASVGDEPPAGWGGLGPPQGDARAALQEAATWLFKCLGEAHETLTDVAKRAAFDAWLEAETADQATGRYRPPTRPGPDNLRRESFSRPGQSAYSSFSGGGFGRGGAREDSFTRPQRDDLGGYGAPRPGGRPTRPQNSDSWGHWTYQEQSFQTRQRSYF